MVTCAVHGCCNRGNCRNGDQSADVTFHIFPKDPLRKRKWVRALLHTSNSQQISNKTCTPEQSRICSAHFEEKYFDRSGVKVRLRKDAVPTIFPDVEDSVAALFNEANTPFKGKLKVAFREDPKVAILEHKTAENEEEIWNAPRKLPPKKAFPKRSFTPTSPTTTTTTTPAKKRATDSNKAITQTPMRRTLLSPRPKTSSSSKNSPSSKKQQVIRNRTPPITSIKTPPPPPPPPPVVSTKAPAVATAKAPAVVTTKAPAVAATKAPAVATIKTPPVAGVKASPVASIRTPQESPAPVAAAAVAAAAVQPVMVAQQSQHPEGIPEDYITSPPETPSHAPRAISPITPQRYHREDMSVSNSPTPHHQYVPVQNGIGCESPARSFTSYYDVPVAGSEIVVTQSMVERSTSVSPHNSMWMKQHPPMYEAEQQVVNQNGTADAATRDAKKILEQKYKKKIRKLQIKKRKNLLKITSINNMINKLGNQNLLIDDRIGRIISKLTYNI